MRRPTLNLRMLTCARIVGGVAGSVSISILLSPANELELIRGKYFEPMHATLEELTLSNNRITEIAANTFSGSGTGADNWELQKLRVLKLEHNQLQ